MEQHSQECPVCSSSIKDGSIEFCPKCNWELLVIPEKASSELRQYLVNKIRLHKKTFSQTNIFREDIASKNQSIEYLEKEKQELSAKIKMLSSDLTKQFEEFKKVKAKADDTEEKQKKIAQLERKVSSLEVALEECKKNKLFPPI